MGAADALYTAIEAVHTADTGAGGLNLKDSNARISNLRREGGAKEQVNKPEGIVHVTPMRAYDGRSDAMQVFRVVFEVEVEKQQNFTRQNAIVDRLKTKFNGVTLGSTGGYAFSPMVWSGSDARDSDKKRVLFESYEVLAFLSSDARLLGHSAALTGYNGGTCFEWSLHREVDIHPATGVMDTHKRYETGENGAQFAAKFYVTTLPPAQGEYAGCVFTVKTGVTVTADVIAESVRTLARLGQNQMQVCEVSGPVNGEWVEAGV